MAVGVVERRGDFGGDPHGVGDGKLLLTAQPVAKRFPFDERHDVVEEGFSCRPTSSVAAVEQGEDVRMLQVGDGLDLTQKPLGADHRGEFRSQHLDRDLTVVLEILRQVHRRHAPLTELALDAVAPAESSGEAIG